MIRNDQPVCFPDDVIVAVSSREDGTMLNRQKGVHADEVLANRRKFCARSGVDYDDAVYHWISYHPEATYDEIAFVGADSATRHGGDVRADVLMTTRRGVGLFLPVADCIGTVVYDPGKHILALMHMGRHSTLTDVIAKTADEFREHGSDVHDCIVWMSPSVQCVSYALDYFDYQDDPRWQGFCQSRDGRVCIDMQGYNRQRFIEAGFSPDNIHISTADTATHEKYFSHSQGDTSERFAILVMMR